MEEIKETEIIAESPKPDSHQASKLTAAIALAALTAVFLVSIFYRPPAVGSDGRYFTICAFKNFIGLPCPGCGLAHSFCALGKGHVTEAFRFNLLGPAVYLLAFLIWLRSIFVLASWTQPVVWMDRAASRAKLIPLFALLFAVFGLGRILYILLTR
jgi:hypothetical protein